MKLYFICSKKSLGFIIIAALLLYFTDAYAQEKSINDNFPQFDVLVSNCPSEGYFFVASENLVSPTDNNYIGIIDNFGTPVYFQLLPEKANNFKLQPNGYLSYSSGELQEIYVLDSSYNYIDTVKINGYELNDADFILTNANKKYLLGYDDQVLDMSSIVDGGKVDAVIKESVIQILDQNGDIVFEWNSADSFNVMDANELSPFVDLTAAIIDYISITDIEIDSDTSLLISCKHMDEISRISTLTGEIIWRLGGKHNEFSFINDELGFSHPTSVNKLPNGNLLIFDSGTMHSTQQSSIVEYSINENDKTATLIRRDGAEKKIYASENGGVTYVANGNNLIRWGDINPSLTELNPNGTIAFEMDFSEHSYSKNIFKSAWTTNIFTPVVDSINFGFWDYTIYRYILVLKNNSDQDVTITSIENFSEAFYTEQSLPFQIPANGTKNITISYYPDNIQTSIVTDVLTICSDTENRRIAQQVKLIGFRDDFIDPTLEIYPANGATNIKIDTALYFKFSEPVRFQDDTDISYENVSDLIIFRKDNSDGLDIAFDAAISSDKDLITIVPRDGLDYSQTYYLELNGNVEDYYELEMNSEKAVSFSTESPNWVQYWDETGIKTYPNPTTESLSLLSDLSPIEGIDVFNLNGQLVLKFMNIMKNMTQINVKSLKNGVYILHVKTANGKTGIYKVIIQ